MQNKKNWKQKIISVKWLVEFELPNNIYICVYVHIDRYIHIYLHIYTYILKYLFIIETGGKLIMGGY